MHGLPHHVDRDLTWEEAFDRAGDDDGFELYFGATSGDVFGSGDRGATWSTAAAHLPPVYSVSAQR